jgi:hypothetical protein
MLPLSFQMVYRTISLRRLGCCRETLAPFLFVLVLDCVLRTELPSSDDGFLLCSRTSSRHPEKRLAVLAYADDLVLQRQQLKAPSGWWTA